VGDWHFGGNKLAHERSQPDWNCYGGEKGYGDAGRWY
jgi:hypothetical protein